MRAGLAFVAGVVGGAVMIAFIAIVRGFGVTSVDFSMLWGSLFTHNLSGGTWVLGFIVHLIVSGLIALIFAGIFEAIRASNWWLGLLGGAIVAIVAGFIIAGYHVPVTGTATAGAESPGPFAINYGVASLITFIVGYLIYGGIVGSLYTPAHIYRLPPSGTGELHEEEAVGVGHEEHARTPETPRRR
jgi:hypothetical protein